MNDTMTWELQVFWIVIDQSFRAVVVKLKGGLLEQEARKARSNGERKARRNLMTLCQDRFNDNSSKVLQASRQRGRENVNAYLGSRHGASFVDQVD